MIADGFARHFHWLRASFSLCTRSGLTPQGPADLPPYFFECIECDNLMVDGGLAFVSCPFVCIHPWLSRNVTFDGMSVSNPIDSPNTDCMDPHSVVDFTVRSSTFACGDDHISIKASDSLAGARGETREELAAQAAAHGLPPPGRLGEAAEPRPTENVLITNCTLLHGQGMVLGSRVRGGMRNVTWAGIKMVGSLSGVRLKAIRKEGGVIDGLTFRDIQMRSVGLLVSMNMDFHHEGVPSATPPAYRNVLLQNISGWGDMAGFFNCLPESPCDDLRLVNVFAQGACIGGVLAHEPITERCQTTEGRPA